MFVFDTGYDPIAIGAALTDTAAQVLVRIRGDRVCYTDPNQPRRRDRKTTPSRQPVRPVRLSQRARAHCLEAQKTPHVHPEPPTQQSRKPHDTQTKV